MVQNRSYECVRDVSIGAQPAALTMLDDDTIRSGLSDPIDHDESLVVLLSEMHLDP